MVCRKSPLAWAVIIQIGFVSTLILSDMAFSQGIYKRSGDVPYQLKQATRARFERRPYSSFFEIGLFEVTYWNGERWETDAVINPLDRAKSASELHEIFVSLEQSYGFDLMRDIQSDVLLRCTQEVIDRHIEPLVTRLRALSVGQRYLEDAMDDYESIFRYERSKVWRLAQAWLSMTGSASISMANVKSADLDIQMMNYEWRETFQNLVKESHRCDYVNQYRRINLGQ